MTTARADQVNIEVTPFYGIVTRCVRRSFLCGKDRYTGRNFDHRKQWVVERLSVLADVFAIDICAYAVMSNHLHLVLHVDKERCLKWNDEEVIARASTLFPSILDNLDTLTEKARAKRIESWRERLWSMSWFMRSLNQYIARKANQEDDCTGRFWEGRFKSQALLDEGAILASMAYVDLNPVRAGIAQGLEDSSWTSIKQRLDEVTTKLKSAKDNSYKKVREDIARPTLANFDDETVANESSRIIPLGYDNYVALLEWTGRMTIGKKGKITSPPNRLLEAKGLDPKQWLESLQSFERFFVLVGSSENLKKNAPHFKRCWAKGHTKAKIMYKRVA